MTSTSFTNSTLLSAWLSSSLFWWTESRELSGIGLEYTAGLFPRSGVSMARISSCNIVIFSCPSQLNRWHCQSVSQSVRQSVSEWVTFVRLLWNFCQSFEILLRAFGEIFVRLVRVLWEILLALWESFEIPLETFERLFRDFWGTFKCHLSDFCVTFERLLRDIQRHLSDF